MSPPVYRLWSGGQEKEGTEQPIPVENPATGEAFATCQSASAQDVDDAVQAAHAVFVKGTWSSSAARAQRADVLEAAAAKLTDALPELIRLEVQQTGRATREMQAQVPSLVRWFRYYAALLRTDERPVFPTVGKLHNWCEREPLGVVVLVTPFNHPLLIAVKKLAPALAAGNSVILKPSELTPLSSLRLGVLLQEAGLPAGVFSVLPGPGIVTAAALATHPLVRSVDITGGTVAGRALGAMAGRNLAKFNAELGGKAPVVVFGDADIEAAVNGVAFGAFVASGQTCVAATRILVEKSVFAEVVAGLERKARFIEANMGRAPTDGACSMGPLVSAKQLRHVESLVDDAVTGTQLATAVVGGARMASTAEYDYARGYYFPPTILVSANGKNILDSRVWKEEAFGPVIVVAPFETEAEAVALANDSEFGLGGAVWTKDLSRAFRVSQQIRAGIVWINTHHRNDPSSPWGGVTSSSGVGSENGREALHYYTMAKSTVINYAAPEDAKAEDWFNDGGAAVRYG